MEKLLELMKQRRIWAGIVGVLTFMFSMLDINWAIDVPVVTDLLTAFGGAISALIMAVLALWSYFKPKK